MGHGGPLQRENTSSNITCTFPGTSLHGKKKLKNKKKKKTETEKVC